MRPVFKKILGFAGVLTVIAGGLIVGYVRAHPLVFNESFLVREVCLVDGGMRIIPEAQWPEFSRRQIDLLVEAGISRDEAERLHGRNRKKLFAKSGANNGFEGLTRKLFQADSIQGANYGPLHCNPKKFSPAARIFAAKEHKEHKEKKLLLCDLCVLLWRSSLVAAMPR